jgi:ribonucleoside-diphosphate reductase alpha chain
MTKKVKDLIEDHGIRNCALLAQAPTGTVSILSNNCSSGIEPMFAFAYWRNYWDNDERKRELCFHPLFIEFMEKNKSVDHFMASHNLTVKDHMEVQKIIQKHVDNAVSKTVNIPKNYNKSKLADLWLEYLPYLKGTTFFREGSRMFLDKDGNPLEPPLVPINLKKAIELYKKEKQIISKTTTDCPKGICEI